MLDDSGAAASLHPRLELAAETIDQPVGVGEEADHVREIENGPIVEPGIAKRRQLSLAGGAGIPGQRHGVFAKRPLATAQLRGAPVLPYGIDPPTPFGDLRPEALGMAEQSVATGVFLRDDRRH